jgi:hypothetical protein
MPSDGLVSNHNRNQCITSTLGWWKFTVNRGQRGATSLLKRRRTDTEEHVAARCGSAVGQQGAQPTEARWFGRLDTSEESQLLRWKRDPVRSRIGGEVRWGGERSGGVDLTVLRCPSEVGAVGRWGRLLTVYFGTPSMFITLWFGFDYGTNPPLGTLII